MHTKTITGLYRPTPITLLLIALNLLIYGGMLWQGSDPLEPGSEDVIQWGGCFVPHLLEGQWWRMIASQFVHFGLLHIAMNMFILYHIGLILERFLGGGKFLFVYLLSGLGASLASLWWYWGDSSVAAGASGAIFGLYGVYIAILTTRLIPTSQRGPLLSSALMFVGYNVLFGFEPGVDNAAHIGGLISGLALGYALYPILKSQMLTRVIGKIALIASLATVAICGACLVDNVRNPLTLAAQDTLVFYDLADELLEIERELNDKARTSPQLTKEESLQGWKQAMSLVEEMHELELTDEDAKYRDELDEWAHSMILYYSNN